MHTSTTRRSILPWLILALTAVLGTAAVFLFFLNRETAVPASWAAAGGARDNLAAWSNSLQQSLLSPIIANLFGALIVTRRPGHRIGWLLLVIGLISSTAMLTQEWAIYGFYTTASPLPGQALAAWITNWLWVPLFSLLLLMVGLFPNGDFLSNRWRRVTLLLLALFAVPMTIGSVIEPVMSSSFQIPNAIVAVSWAEAIYSYLFTLGVLFMPVAVVIVLASVLVRYRRRQGRERQQLKWLLAGVAFMAFFVLVGLAVSFGLENPLGDMMVNAAILWPLIGIGVALLRHQLYDIDIIIRRTLVYTAVSVVLALVYLGSVVLLQRLFVTAVGQQSPLAIVLSTLLIAALFAPLRRRVQRFIDRRFYRRRYNAERTLAQFAQTARDEVKLNALTSELVRVIQETMQPTHVSLLLNPSASERKSESDA